MINGHGGIGRRGNGIRWETHEGKEKEEEKENGANGKKVNDESVIERDKRQERWQGETKI